jgi:hypothetical protein
MLSRRAVRRPKVIDGERKAKVGRGWLPIEGEDWLPPMAGSRLAAVEHIVEEWPPRLDDWGHSRLLLA